MYYFPSLMDALIELLEDELKYGTPPQTAHSWKNHPSGTEQPVVLKPKHN